MALRCSNLVLLAVSVQLFGCSDNSGLSNTTDGNLTGGAGGVPGSADGQAGVPVVPGAGGLSGSGGSSSVPPTPGGAGGGEPAANAGAGGLVGTGGAPSDPVAIGNGDPVDAGAAQDTPTSWTIVSPNETIRATIELADLGGQADFPAGLRLYFSVEVGDGTGYTEVVDASPLGIARTDANFIDGLALVAAGSGTRVDETYPMLTGKRLEPRNFANQRILSFSNPGGNQVELELRAYDDGFAFRYRFPEVDGTVRTVDAEATGFRVPAGSRAWMLPYDPAGDVTPAYENFWQHDLAAGTPSPTTVGWCFPALFRTPTDHFALIFDTNVTRSYFAAHLAPDADALVYRVAFPEAPEANGLGDVNPTSTLPWATAWRVVVAGSSPAAIVNTTLATDLADPSVLTDTSWIQPGRASWSWWSDDPSPMDFQVLSDFVDLARDMTWEYSLVDAGWPDMTNGGDWTDLTAYAASQGVGTILWYNSGGPNSSFPLIPRDRMFDPAIRQAEFATITQAGVRGIKVDFWNSDKQFIMQYYLDVLRDAAAADLVVNFHGSTIQRGWQRTYPNLMSTESVRGAEWYKFQAEYPAGAPQRNTIVAFTRNVMGSMDFTPGTFTDAAFPHVTTFGHELALSVVFESGVQHFADRVAGYTALPAGPRTFLMQVPVAWDETRYVQGLPGEWVVLARRKGDVWYVGGIEGSGQARDLNLDLSFLPAGTFAAVVITDGGDDESFTESTATLTPADPLALAVRANGGFVATLTPAP